MRKRGWLATLSLLLTAAVLSLGADGCVSKATFEAYRDSVNRNLDDIKLEGDSLHRWMLDAQTWMNQMEAWARTQDPTGVPPVPPPPPCQNPSDCEWGGQ